MHCPLHVFRSCLPTGGLALRLPASTRKHVSLSHQTDPGLRSGDWDADWLSPDPPPPQFGFDLSGSFWVLGRRFPGIVVDELVTRLFQLVLLYVACRTLLDMWLGV